MKYQTKFKSPPKVVELIRMANTILGIVTSDSLRVAVGPLLNSYTNLFVSTNIAQHFIKGPHMACTHHNHNQMAISVKFVITETTMTTLKLNWYWKTVSPWATAAEDSLYAPYLYSPHCLQFIVVSVCQALFTRCKRLR